jgi:hypothetical protein
MRISFNKFFLGLLLTHANLNWVFRMVTHRFIVIIVKNDEKMESEDEAVDGFLVGFELQISKIYINQSNFNEHFSVPGSLYKFT